MKSKIGNILFGIGFAIVFIFSMWFFILYGIADPEAYFKMDISEPIQNRTRDVIIIYQFEFREPLTIIEEIEDQRTAILDVAGIITGVTVGAIVVIISKILDRFWPSKKK